MWCVRVRVQRVVRWWLLKKSCVLGSIEGYKPATTLALPTATPTPAITTLLAPPVPYKMRAS